MGNDKPKLNISISREHDENKDIIKATFEGFDVDINADYMRFSAESMPMQIIIFLYGAFVGGAAWDLLKIGIKKIYEKFSDARVTIKDNNSIMYTIKKDFTVVVMVIPDRSKEFEHIKTFEDLIKHIDSEKDDK